MVYDSFQAPKSSVGPDRKRSEAKLRGSSSSVLLDVEEPEVEPEVSVRSQAVLLGQLVLK